MSDVLGNSPPTDAQIDRLVDGELDDEEFRELMMALERAPGGWRRCAMAFLENQAWQREIGCDPVEQAPVPTAPPKKVVRATGGQWRLQLLGMGMAASFAVAFFWGSRISIWDGHDADNPNGVARRLPVGEAQGPTNPVPPGPTVTPAGHVAEANSQPYGNLQWIAEGGDGPALAMEVPVFESDDGLAQWLIETAPPVPVDVERALRSLGYEVSRDRQWTPVLADGRHRVLVPVDQLEVKPLGFVP